MSLRWLFNRRVGSAFAWSALVILVAVAINLVGISAVGTTEGWRQWLEEHADYFLAWRLCLYAATVYGWWWMRRRLREREPSAESRQYLLRTEIAAAAAIMLLEGSVLFERL